MFRFFLFLGFCHSLYYDILRKRSNFSYSYEYFSCWSDEYDKLIDVKMQNELERIKEGRKPIRSITLEPIVNISEEELAARFLQGLRPVDRPVKTEIEKKRDYTRWHLFYTLLRNPQLCSQRKHQLKLSI